MTVTGVLLVLSWVSALVALLVVFDDDLQPVWVLARRLADWSRLTVVWMAIRDGIAGVWSLLLRYGARR